MENRQLIWNRLREGKIRKQQADFTKRTKGTWHT